VPAFGCDGRHLGCPRAWSLGGRLECSTALLQHIKPLAKHGVVGSAEDDALVPTIPAMPEQRNPVGSWVVPEIKVF
jgi:hypothetical protein